MQAHFGARSYRLFCVGCHGADGRGNAATSRALQVPLADLTGIAARNGGAFPRDEVTQAITGLGEGGHAQLRMAPWAEVFADEFAAFRAEIVVNQMVDRRIQHLVDYIESIQR